MTSNAVLGGGALGLTVALRLVQRGEAVTLYEKEPAPGGLAAGFPLGPSYLEKFYHHLFKSDTTAVRIINEIGLSDRLVWPRPNTSVLVGGEMYRLDSPRAVLGFSPLPALDRLRLAGAIGYLRLEPNYRRLERTTADAWLRRWMGARAYETVWRPLLMSKFGPRYEQIVASWFWARIHLRSSSLGYLRGGFQQMYDRLVGRIRDHGGVAHFETEVQGIATASSGRLQVATASGSEEFDRVISTLPTRLTIRLTPELGDDYAHSYGNLESYGAHCVILSLDRPLTDVYWLNVNDPGYPFLALVEHTNYMPPADYGGRHVVYLGNYLPMDHRLFAMSDNDVLAEFLPALRRINPAFRDEWVTEHRIFKAPFAQPIVTLGYAERLPPHRTPVRNLYLANMSHVYPQDRGQNYSMALAEKVVASLPAQPEST